MKSTDIRALRKKFREHPEQAHKRVAPASLIVKQADDPTTMFNSAGMQQFVPYLMWKPHPQGRRIYNIQGCVRTTDIDEVGDASHLTFFEMMGNRSLGDYFKKEAITRSRKFLTGKDRLGLDPKMLAVSVFAWDADAPRDEESAYIREETWVPKERIAYLGKENNRRGPAWATWPCGPDTEIFYRIGEGEPPKKFDAVKDDEKRLEIRNNVFMAYYKDEHGHFVELKDKNVDTGMWFERINILMQCITGEIKKPIKDASIYETDLFVWLIEYISTLVREVRSQRIIADHLRAAFLLIEEGLVPTNEGRWYVLRRLIRRAYFQFIKSKKEPNMWITHFVEIIFQAKKIFNVIYTDKFSTKTSTIIVDEVSKFSQTIETGKWILESYLATKTWDKILLWDKAFKLYDTYGFPLELTEEIAKEYGIQLDIAWFQVAMEKAQNLSRQGGKKMFTKEVNRADHIEWLPPTKFVGYEYLEKEDVKILKDMEIDWQRVLVFDITPFYAEGGGQTGDQGRLITDNGEELLVKDVQKYGGVWLHFVE